MKKKACLLLLALPLALGCGSGNTDPVYSFQLGKEAGTHFGAFLTLTNQPYVLDGVTGLKKFELAVKMKNGTQEESEGIMATVLAMLDDGTGNPVVPGYYKISETENKALGGNEMWVGLDFTYIVGKVKTFYKEMMQEDLNIDDEEFQSLNNDDVIQGLLDASISGDTVHFFIPVSVTDAILQLYWYGSDIIINLDPDADSIVEVKEVEKHPRGSQPTDEQIKKINETYESSHVTRLVHSYRRFHRVQLPLKRQ